MVRGRRQGFARVKECLTTAPLLVYADMAKPFVLQTDACKTGLGAVLAQKDPEGREHPIAYASRTLNKHEQNYAVTEWEALAVIWALKYFRFYLFGHEFSIVTDHHALRWLMTAKHDNGRLARWALLAQEYWPFTIEYKSGRQHNNADALSRMYERSARGIRMTPAQPERDRRIEPPRRRARTRFRCAKDEQRPPYRTRWTRPRLHRRAV